MTAVDVRAIRDDAELAVATDLHNDVRPRERLTLDEVRAFIARARAHCGFVAWRDDAAVGFARASLLHERAELIADVVVPAAHRRRGVGSALYDALSTWAHALGCATARAWLEEDDLGGIAFATRNGFVEVGRSTRFVLDVGATAPPRTDLPAGIAIVTWAERPDAAQGMHVVAREAAPDIPGNDDVVVPPFEQWFSDHMSGSRVRADATFVALHGDEVVGYATFWLSDAQPATALHDMTAVKRGWRNRGIARALKSAQVEWARRNGYERLVTGNEERNAPIRKLNAELGYKPEATRILMRGELSGAT